MAKVKFENLRSAVVETTNATDDARAYGIKANVNVSNTNHVTSVDSGEVRKLEQDTIVATFNKWGDGNLNISFNNVLASEYCAIVEAVNQFNQDVVEEVKTRGFDL